MFKSSVFIIAAAVGMVGALPTDAGAGMVTFIANNPTVITGSFAFNTDTNAFSSVNLLFNGSVTSPSNPAFTNPFSFALNSLSPQTVAINVGTGVGVSSFFGGQVAIPGAGPTEPALNVASSSYLHNLADDIVAAPAGGVQQTIQWRIGQFDGESFLLGFSDVSVVFDVTQEEAPSGGQFAVPEPATTPLVVGSLLLCAALTRRRRVGAD